MSWLKAPKSLSFKISLTLAFGLVIYTLISIMLTMYFMFIPISQQAADDMAALISVSSRAWVNLDEQERLDFQQHLLDNHRLFIRSEPVPMVVTPMSCRFIPRLEQALSRQTGQQINFLHGEKKDCCFWAKIQQDGQNVHIGFLDKRIAPQPPKAFAGILLTAFLLITIVTLLLVRRISRPVKKLSIAADRLGRGQFATRIPETGTKEFISLAHSFNRMAEELAQLMSNRAVLFGGISHDLRTPITRMQIALELLEDGSNERLITGLRNDLNEMDGLIQKALEFVATNLRRDKQRLSRRVSFHAPFPC